MAWMPVKNASAGILTISQFLPLRTLRSSLLASLLLLLLTNGCASIPSPFGDSTKERFVVCAYDPVWESAVETMKNYPVTKSEKYDGVIETAWVEQPAQGQPYGLFGREGMPSKERSRMTMTVSRLDDVTKVSLVENRQFWGFTGGARLYQWRQVPPSEEAMKTVMHTLETKLKEHGCPVNHE